MPFRTPWVRATLDARQVDMPSRPSPTNVPSPPRPGEFHAILLAGPPASAGLWHAVLPRWEGKVRARAVELFDPAPSDPTVEGRAAHVAGLLRELPSPRVLIAHGAAVPIALRAAVQARPDRLVLSNGPVHRLDPVLRALADLCRVPTVAANTVLHPAVLSRWLASSIGLRRAVINPYVMDRDTVVALLAPLVRTSAHRVALARFLADLPRAVENPPRFDGPTLLYWGDADPLYPASHADEARRWLPNAALRTLAGGQHMHPEERPWALADAVYAWLCEAPTLT